MSSHFMWLSHLIHKNVLLAFQFNFRPYRDFYAIMERSVWNHINGTKGLKYFWPFARLQRITHCRLNAILNCLVLPLNGMAYVNILKRPLWLAHYVFSCYKLCNIFVHAQFLVLLTFIFMHYAFFVVANFFFLQNAKLIWIMDVV